MNYFGLSIVICFPLLAAFVAVAAKPIEHKESTLDFGGGGVGRWPVQHYSFGLVTSG